MSEALDLLASIDAEFGKKKKEKKGIAPADGGRLVRFKGRMVEQIAKGSYRNDSSDDPAVGANEIAHSVAFLVEWRAEARETWVKTQICECCNSTTRFIAGEYVRFRNAKSHATIQRRSEIWTDLWHFGVELPRTVVKHTETVQTCPDCMELEDRVEQLWDLAQRVILREAEAQLVIPGIDS